MEEASRRRGRPHSDQEDEERRAATRPRLGRGNKLGNDMVPAESGGEFRRQRHLPKMRHRTGIGLACVLEMHMQCKHPRSRSLQPPRSQGDQAERKSGGAKISILVARAAGQWRCRDPQPAAGGRSLQAQWAGRGSPIRRRSSHRLIRRRRANNPHQKMRLGSSTAAA